MNSAKTFRGRRIRISRNTTAVHSQWPFMVHWGDTPVGCLKRTRIAGSRHLEMVWQHNRSDSTFLSRMGAAMALVNLWEVDHRKDGD